MSSLQDKSKRQKRREQKEKRELLPIPTPFPNPHPGAGVGDAQRRGILAGNGVSPKKSPGAARRPLLKRGHFFKPYYHFKLRARKKCWCFLVGLTPLMAGASPIIPTGWDINHLYYQIGGGSDYAPPAAPYSTPINLSVRADLGLGNQCGMYNPALSISDTLNDLEDSVNNLTESLIANATGSIAEMPMYFLALANPTLYNLPNNKF